MFVYKSYPKPFVKVQQYKERIWRYTSEHRMIRLLQHELYELERGSDNYWKTTPTKPILSYDVINEFIDELHLSQDALTRTQLPLVIEVTSSIMESGIFQ